MKLFNVSRSKYRLEEIKNINTYANEFHVQFNAVSIDRLPSNSCCLSFLIFLRGKRRGKKESSGGKGLLERRRSTE